MFYPTAHKDKLTAAINNNSKLTAYIVDRLKEAISIYDVWIQKIEEITNDEDLNQDQKVKRLVNELNIYKNYVEIDLIFDSEDDFLYRQKGQMKLDNSIIEEFLPRLVHPNIIGEFDRDNIIVGPTKSLSNVHFRSDITGVYTGGGLIGKEKDQDFAVSKKLFLKASHKEDYSNSIEIKTQLSFIAAECKTNLDKTMFQEACATAADLKKLVLGSKYFLVCEWLDMKPIDTSVTDIDSVLVLRKSKRMSSDLRKNFSTVDGRKKYRDSYISKINENPIDYDVIMKIVLAFREMVASQSINEKEVLFRGYF
ncbi:MAG: Bpu10I family restriction endonuclease [Bdellovibrionales bacterium]|nr:Bpu10I family restriction endonuclease [Bdellovibrionales bacterium]